MRKLLRAHGQEIHQKSILKRHKGLTIGGLLLFFMALFFVARLNSLYSHINTRSDRWAKPIPKEKKVFNLLVMGYGGPGHDGAYLTDTMIFISVDTEHKRAVVVSIPRDIWVQIPTNDGELFMRKINSAYQTGLFKKNYPAVLDKYAGEQGAGDLVKSIVGSIAGQPLDYYLAIDFDGFKRAVDTLGGVEMHVKRSFTDDEYPIDGKEDDLCGLDPDDITGFDEREKIATESPVLAYPCRYETLHFDSGKQLMNGETALKFVRSRHAPEDGGDFNRARRQQLFMEALRDRILNVGFLPKVLPLLNDLEASVRTDMPVEFVQRMIGEAPSASDYAVQHIVLTTDNYLQEAYSEDRQYILMSRDGADSWKGLHDDLKLYMKGITPTPKPTIVPSKTPAKKGS